MAETEKMIDYNYISDNDALKKAVASLNGTDALAVDLEADSMYHYHERVCLIQMAQNGRTWVIDPLEVDDMTPLAAVFADESTEKFFHGADYDIRSLYRDFGIEINNLFDTELASRFLGVAQTGLASVLSTRFNIQVEKKYQKKDWSVRPLPSDMIAYAAGDVIYLHELARQLKAELKAAGRDRWVDEECRRLTRVRPAENNHNPFFLRFSGAGRLDRRSLAVLEAVLVLRDRIAMQKDRPVFKIMSSRAMLRLAEEKPMTVAALKQGRILSDRQMAMYAADIVAAIQAAMDLAPADLPVYPRNQKPRPDPSLAGRIKALKNQREAVADSLNMPAGQLINNTLLTAVAMARPVDKTALAAVEGIRNWQVEALGDALIAALSPDKNQRKG